jgi:hypothetical protein
MRLHELLNEHKKGRRAVKHNLKPRNPVAHAAQTVAKGSGAHKDKKKADKQGDVKHKGQAMAEAGSAAQQAAIAIAKKKKQRVAEGSEIKIPTEDGITMQDIRLMAGEGPLTKKTILQAIAVIRKQRRPQGVAEKLNLKAMDVGAVIKDFEKSNAPQFRGKTKEKRKQMAIAAKMGAMKPKKKKAHEGWTTDSLADQLFEHERTYEDNE